jgi:hypothetical protein
MREFFDTDQNPSSLRQPTPPPPRPAPPPAPPAGWREGEQAAAAHLRSLGDPDARVTPTRPDCGIDVTASGAAAP